jgi:hypothetical protein
MLPARIVCIDDLPANLDLWSQAAREIAPDTGVHPVRITNEDSFRKCVDYLGDQGRLDSAVVLLDLGYRESEELFASSVEYIQSLCVRLGDGFSFTDDAGVSFEWTNLGTTSNVIIPSSVLDGLSLLEAVLRRNPDKCLVNIVSGRGNNPQVEIFVGRVNNWIKDNGLSGRVAVVIGGQMPINQAFARALLDEGIKKWKEIFRGLHDAAPVDTFLSRWLAAFDSLGDAGPKYFCIHGDSQRVGTIEGSTAFYLGLAGELFQIESLGQGTGHSCDVNDLMDLKALFQLEDEPENLDNKSAFPVSGGSPGTGEKCISTKRAAAILREISGAEVEIIGGDRFRLPCQPALPFLLALVVLFERMKNQDEGMLNPAAKIRLTGSEDGPNRISIPLKKNEPLRGKIGARWLEKLEDFQSEIANDTKGGVCPALWDVLVARVRGITTDAQAGRVKLKLLQLFEGPGRLVAGVSFGPHFIHIHW